MLTPVAPPYRPPRVSATRPLTPHQPHAHRARHPQVMIPVVEQWCRYTGHPVSRFMMPLSYAAILGGLCTVIGTSTNLIARGLAQQDLPTLRIPFFEVGACRATWMLSVCTVRRILVVVPTAPDTWPC